MSDATYESIARCVKAKLEGRVGPRRPKEASKNGRRSVPDDWTYVTEQEAAIQAELAHAWDEYDRPRGLCLD